MGQTSRTPKGEINIINAEGRIRLRWRFNKQRYSLNLPFAYSSENLLHATVKVAEIKLDMLKGTFDSSLEKYKPKDVKPVSLPVKRTSPEPKVISLDGLAAKFIEWTTQIKNINIDHSIDYSGVLRVLERYINVPLEEIAGKIAVESWSVGTYNKRLSFLNSFFIWLLDTGVITTNPLLHVSKRREKKKKKNERRKPLTEKEISTFLDAIQKNTYCHKSSPVKHSFYYPFLRFMFLTGVRNAEAIGLRIRHIHFSEQRIEISEAFARTVKGTHHAARISKGTKVGNTRFLPLTEELRLLLLPQIEGREQDDFVFPSPKGLSIDDRMLEKRVFKPVLKAIGLDDRDLYAARHSFGTRAAQQGMFITDIAYLMGHTTVETTIRNYVNVEKPSLQMPSLLIASI